MGGWWASDKPGDILKQIGCFGGVLLVFFSLVLVGVYVFFGEKKSTDGGLLGMNGSTMGTRWSVTFHPPADNTDSNTFRFALNAPLDRIERAMSHWKKSSAVSKFNAHEGADWFAVPHDVAVVVAEAQRISAATDGAFDITVAPLRELWGFAPAERRQEPPTQDEIDAALEHVGYTKLHVRLEPPALRKDTPGLRIDPSAIAKGYAVDALADVLDEHGQANFLIDVGGELRARGRSKSSRIGWPVGIETPAYPNDGRPDVAAIERVVTLADASLATSGDYRNFVMLDDIPHPHVIDPRTGRPAAKSVASASVMHPSCMTADAWATALLVLPPDDAIALAERHGVAAMLIVRRPGDTYATIASEMWKNRTAPSATR